MIWVHVIVILALASGLLALVRARLIQVDLFFPWFVAVVVLGFAATQPGFVNWLGAQLGILYPPIAVVFLSIFLLVGVVVTLTIFVTRLRERQVAIIQHLALSELGIQEERLRDARVGAIGLGPPAGPAGRGF